MLSPFNWMLILAAVSKRNVSKRNELDFEIIVFRGSVVFQLLILACVRGQHIDEFCRTLPGHSVTKRSGRTYPW